MAGRWGDKKKKEEGETPAVDVVFFLSVCLSIRPPLSLVSLSPPAPLCTPHGRTRGSCSPPSLAPGRRSALIKGSECRDERLLFLLLWWWLPSAFPLPLLSLLALCCCCAAPTSASRRASASLGALETTLVLLTLPSWPRRDMIRLGGQLPGSAGGPTGVS